MRAWRMAVIAGCMLAGLALSVEFGTAAEIVGPEPAAKSGGETRVAQGNPPLVRLTVRGDDGRPPAGQIVKWNGPIGDGRLAQACGDGLTVSTAVVGTFEFLAVIVPGSVAGPEDIEIVRHVLVVAPPQPPPATPLPLPPVTPAPAPLPTDLSAQARQWLQTVPESARHRRTEVAQTLREIGTSSTLRSIDELELFLGVGLAWSIGADAPAWASFSGSANAALDQLKRSGATKEQYAAALVGIANGISD